MQYSEYFRPTEVTSSLIALTRVPEQVNFNWEEHPNVSKTVERLIDLLPGFKKNHIVQTGLILDRLRIKSPRKLWRCYSSKMTTYRSVDCMG